MPDIFGQSALVVVKSKTSNNWIYAIEFITKYATNLDKNYLIKGFKLPLTSGYKTHR